MLIPLYPERLREFLRIWAIAMTVLLAFVLAINTWHLTYESIIYDARAFSMLGQPLAIGQSLTVPALLLLSALKFYLVVAMFMHLRYEKPLLSRFFTIGGILAGALYLVVLAALGAVAIF